MAAKIQIRVLFWYCINTYWDKSDKTKLFIKKMAHIVSFIILFSLFLYLFYTCVLLPLSGLGRLIVWLLKLKSYKFDAVGSFLIDILINWA